MRAFSRNTLTRECGVFSLWITSVHKQFYGPEPAGWHNLHRPLVAQLARVQGVLAGTLGFHGWAAPP